MVNEIELKKENPENDAVQSHYRVKRIWDLPNGIRVVFNLLVARNDKCIFRHFYLTRFDFGVFIGLIYG